jgi:RRXRR protein
VGDSNSPLIKDQQALLAGGIKPNKFEGKKGNQPSAFCLLPSAFQGGSLGKTQTESTGRSSLKHEQNASLILFLCVDQSRRDVHIRFIAKTMQKSVPVIDRDQKPLMPTTRARADKWIKSSKATPFWKKGIFCVRLNIEPSARNYQDIACGIDPGSKMEGYTVASSKHQFLNIQAIAVDWVKSHLETRRNMRRSRRFRKTPCRQPRWNRLANKIRLAPSTKARWQWKLRIANWLNKIYPLTSSPT